MGAALEASSKVLNTSAKNTAAKARAVWLSTRFKSSKENETNIGPEKADTSAV